MGGESVEDAIISIVAPLLGLLLVAAVFFMERALEGVIGRRPGLISLGIFALVWIFGGSMLSVAFWGLDEVGKSSLAWGGFVWLIGVIVVGLAFTVGSFLYEREFS